MSFEYDGKLYLTEEDAACAMILGWITCKGQYTIGSGKEYLSLLKDDEVARVCADAWGDCGISQEALTCAAKRLRESLGEGEH